MKIRIGQKILVALPGAHALTAAVVATFGRDRRGLLLHLRGGASVPASCVFAAYS